MSCVSWLRSSNHTATMWIHPTKLGQQEATKLFCFFHQQLHYQLCMAFGPLCPCVLVTSSHPEEQAWKSPLWSWRSVHSHRQPYHWCFHKWRTEHVLLTLPRKPEPTAVPLGIRPRCGTSGKKRGVANVTGSNRRFIIWNSGQILESRSYCVLPRRGKTQQPLPTWSKRRLLIDCSAGSYLRSEERGAQTECDKKADVITGINILNSLSLAVGTSQCFRRFKPVAKLDEEKNFLPGSRDRQLPKSME